MNGQKGHSRLDTKAADKYRFSRDLLEETVKALPKPDQQLSQRRLSEHQLGLDALRGKYPKIFIDIMKEVVIRDSASPKLLLGILRQVEQFSQPGSLFHRDIGAPHFGEGKPLREFIMGLNEFSDALDMIPPETELRIYDQVSQTRAQVYGSSPRIQSQATFRNELDEYQFQAGMIMEKLFLETDKTKLKNTLEMLTTQLKKLNTKLKKSIETLKSSDAYRTSFAKSFSGVYGKTLQIKKTERYEVPDAPLAREVEKPKTQTGKIIRKGPGFYDLEKFRPDQS